MKKTSQFKSLLHSNQLEFMMEAHSGLSARIVQEAGFKAIWGSGLSISAMLGVRDNNEASWTQVLEVIEFMSDATDIPIMLDADTGYGNFNNMRRLVRKLEQREVAAVCIEDKLFPKTNSFIESEQQPLADINEFAGKIKAAKDTQTDSDFSVVARVEAFIAGWGLSEAMKRAEAYYKAGADAILMHSKISTPDQVLVFMKEWGDTCPVVIVPTMYYSTPTSVFKDAGVSVAIWANHLIRASIGAMQQTARKIHEENTLLTVEDEIVTVKEIFRLQNAHELKEAEQAYLPDRNGRQRAIILAASRGSNLDEYTSDRPKAMIPVRGRSLLERMVNHFNDVGINDVVVVGGYKAEAIDSPGIRLVQADRYEEAKELYSLTSALEFFDQPLLVVYGDILFKKYILQNLLNEPGDIVIVVDAEREYPDNTRYTDYVKCSRPISEDYFDDPVFLYEMSSAFSENKVDGEWIGMTKLSERGVACIQKALEELRQGSEFESLRMKDLFAHLIGQGEEIRVVYVRGHWLDVDDIEVLTQAVEF